MDEAAILSRLNALFREIFDNVSLVLSPETAAADVPGWDSMTHITIVVEVERRFGVKFQTSEIETLRDIGDFLALIGKKTG